MLNKPAIIRTLGALVLISGICMLTAVAVSLIMADGQHMALLISSLLTIVPGGITLMLAKTDATIGKRDGYFIVTLSWIIFSLFGSLPFVISGSIPSFTDAFFETMSGFTTTGATILKDIEAVPPSLLYWRSMTQWLGGMGIIVLSLAILPMLKMGSMQLFIAEVPGVTYDKLHPKLRETAKRLWAIYAVFTLAEMILLIIAGMPPFDALCHSFTTMATGGYSTKNASVAAFSSPYIHYIITFFMFLAGTNFALAYFGLHGRFKKIFTNQEFLFYLAMVVVSIIITTLVLTTGINLPVEQAVREASFQVVSIITTTGFITADYLYWGPFLILLIFVLMFTGGSAGSTGGGIKMVRLLLMAKNSRLELRRLIHPSAVIPVRYNHRSVPPNIIYNVMAFIVFYFFIAGISGMIIAAMGYDLATSFSTAAATLGNIGPGLGAVGPVENYSHFPLFGKWFLSFLMLTGRLELFTVLILFSKWFYRN